MVRLEPKQPWQEPAPISGVALNNAEPCCSPETPTLSEEA